MLCFILLVSYTCSTSFWITCGMVYSIITLIGILCISIRTSYEYDRYTFYKTSEIPAIIYTYWHSEQIPPSVKKCIDSWKRHVKNYTIHVINEKNLQKYINKSLLKKIKNGYTHQQRADLIRLEVLKHTGGFWLDATIYLNQSLDWVHAYQRAEQSEYVGFKLNSVQTTSTPVVENWFMASIPNSAFIQDWSREFSAIVQYPTEREFVTALRNKQVDFQGISDPYYLTMHISCLSILKHNSYALSLLVTEEGPYKYMNYFYTTTLSFPFVVLFLQGTESPLIKWRGMERNIIEWCGLYHLLT